MMSVVVESDDVASRVEDDDPELLVGSDAEDANEGDDVDGMV